MARRTNAVDGRRGNDLICGAPKAGGGPGDDMIFYKGNRGGDPIPDDPHSEFAQFHGDLGDDTIKMTGDLIAIIETGAGADWVSTADANQVITAGAGRDTVTAGGGLGNDTLSGGEDRDRMYGEAGNDRLTGGPLFDVGVGGPRGRTSANETWRSGWAASARSHPSSAP